MKLVFVYNKDKLSGRLTKIFTGSYCYHVGFLDDEAKFLGGNGKIFYDMDLLRRKRMWYGLYNPLNVVIIDCPARITTSYLEMKLTSDDQSYGFLDYLLFALRPIYHLFGKSTRNASGLICSEMVYNDLRENDWKVEFSEVPSPADLERALGVEWKS